MLFEHNDLHFMKRMFFINWVIVFQLAFSQSFQTMFKKNDQNNLEHYKHVNSKFDANLLGNARICCELCVNRVIIWREHLQRSQIEVMLTQ